MRIVIAILILSSLFLSCDSSSPKDHPAGKGKTAGTENPPEMGIWENDTYTDELGQTSDRDCIRNRGFITGGFSTAALPYAPLNVKFLIFGPNSISVQLFENGGADPVKAVTPRSYTVTIVGSDGTQHRVKAMNYSDKVSFERTDAGTVHDVFMKGGKVLFTLSDDFTPAIHYQFTIENATGYDAAYRTLTGK